MQGSTPTSHSTITCYPFLSLCWPKSLRSTHVGEIIGYKIYQHWLVSMKYFKSVTNQHVCYTPWCISLFFDTSIDVKQSPRSIEFSRFSLGHFTYSVVVQSSTLSTIHMWGCGSHLMIPRHLLASDTVHRPIHNFQRPQAANGASLSDAIILKSMCICVQGYQFSPHFISSLYRTVSPGVWKIFILTFVRVHQYSLHFIGITLSACMRIAPGDVTEHHFIVIIVMISLCPCQRVATSTNYMH